MTKCLTCGKEIQRTSKKNGRWRYCSEECRKLLRRGITK